LETLSLTDLITACRAGDRKAQEQIFRSYYSDFLKICLRYAADAPAAEAALSDAFYKIFTKMDTYTGKGSFEGWMRQIVVNTCLSQIRSNKDKEVALPPSGEVPDGNVHAMNDALSRIGIQELLRLIQSLPVTSRTVFNLYVFEGYSHKEIAGQLGISEGTSHWHLSSARQWLRSKI
jgi:RNA polymerase sigma-70 factor (ECF subfamily)